MIFHNKSADDAIKELNSNVNNGLNSNQIEEKFKEYGKNVLREKKKKTNFQRFIDQFKDIMILILIGAAIVSFVVACTGHDVKEFFEPFLILLIVVINAVMGVAQESKAEKALDALKSMSSLHTKVIRDGEEKIIESAELVPGDIIRLEAGDFVSADARLIKSVNLKSEESALTGESVPSEKDAHIEVKEKSPIGDRTNMIFSGCSITYGTARAVVTATGMDTEMGKIANMLDNENDTQTPLQQKLSQLGKYFGIAALVACAIVFIMGVTSNLPVLEIFMTAVSLAVSAIPEGLPAIVTIVLSIGVQRMVKKNAIIRRLPAVETLGGASVICSDKTGTLTQNRMTLVKAYINGEDNLIDINSKNSDEVKNLLKYATLCCDGSVIIKGNEEQHIGDPTETAIILAAYKNGMPKEELNNKYSRLAEIPFDSDRKLMTTINNIDGKNVVIVKGAFDMMAPKCINGNINSAKEINDKMSSDALRVIGVAYKIIDKVPTGDPTTEEMETELNFMGLVGMIDPPRPEAKQAVATCRQAGIKPVMITGDHVVTASAIAREIGILKEGDKAITGMQLDSMTDSELDNEVESISVYARVSPENKIRIVKAWQRKDQVVAMTGDGVNDAPALKAADIGCAMGITGTDVAKGAADMTLTDDNFSTIVHAVREGRGIYDNIKKVVIFLLGTNIGEILTVFFAMLLWKQRPLLSMQLLWINLITDSMPAIALGMEAVEKDIMDKKPKPKNEGLFANGVEIQVIFQGIMFAVLTLIGFVIGQNVTGTLEGGQTLAFMILSLTQVVQSFNMRSNKSLFKIGFFTNSRLSLACLLSLILVAIVLFTPLSALFGLVLLPFEMYLLGLALSIVPFIVIEILKFSGVIRHK